MDSEKPNLLLGDHVTKSAFLRHGKAKLTHEFNDDIVHRSLSTIAFVG